MKHLFANVLDINQKNNPEEVIKRIQILRVGTFFDPRYGKVEITPQMIGEMVVNFSNNVRKIPIMLDAGHNSDKESYGWFKKLEGIKSNNELWAEVEMTPRGQKALSDKDYALISADFDTAYKDNETLKSYGCVLLGAALTNRPVVKGMQPVIQLSEAPTYDSVKEFLESNPEDAISKKIAKLIGEGYDKDQAVAIAYKYKDENKLSDQGVTMFTAEQFKQLSEKYGTIDASILLGILLSLKEESVKFSESSTKLKEAEGKVTTLSEEVRTLKEAAAISKKEAAFSKLLHEKKAVPAQKEAYMKGDLEEFAKLQSDVKFSEKGTGVDDAIDPSKAEDEMIAKITELAEKEKISFDKADDKFRADPKNAELIKLASQVKK